MDPYLEHPRLWPDVHNSLVAALRDALAPVLRPRYVVALEERTYLDESDGLAFAGRPDLSVSRPGDAAPAGPGEATPAARDAAGSVAVLVPAPDRLRETYLEVRAVPGGEVVTVLEVLSPANKARGEGRRIYEEKRRAILGSATSLVEVDLLRGGAPMDVRGAPPAADYRILVSRGRERPRARLFPFSVRDPIPTFALPLAPGDEEPSVDLSGALRRIYETAGYDLRIDYRSPPVPPLAEADRAWAEGLVAAA
jgi:hypothetical protein